MGAVWTVVQIVVQIIGWLAIAGFLLKWREARKAARERDRLLSQMLEAWRAERGDS